VGLERASAGRELKNQVACAGHHSARDEGPRPTTEKFTSGAPAASSTRPPAGRALDVDLCIFQAFIRVENAPGDQSSRGSAGGSGGGEARASVGDARRTEGPESGATKVEEPDGSTDSSAGGVGPYG